MSQRVQVDTRFCLTVRVSGNQLKQISLCLVGICRTFHFLRVEVSLAYRRNYETLGEYKANIITMG